MIIVLCTIRELKRFEDFYWLVYFQYLKKVVGMVNLYNSTKHPEPITVG